MSKSVLGRLLGSARDAGAAEVAAAPGDAGGRLFDLGEVIDRPEQLRRHRRVLTAPGNELSIGEHERRLLALVEVGDNQAVLYWSNRREHRAYYEALMQAVGRTAFEVIESREASADIIRHFYSERGAERLTLDAYRGDLDGLISDIVRAGRDIKASDIHVQVDHHRAVVRYRVHGDLVFGRVLPPDEAERMCVALYNSAPSEAKQAPEFNRRLRLDAQVDWRVDRDHAVKLRWASGPVFPDGFDVTLRILAAGENADSIGFDGRGYTEWMTAAFERAIRQPTGLMLLVGATGSGKSTTLMTAGTRWLRFHQGRKLLRSIEDPVEYIISGARHSAVQYQRGDDGEGVSAFGDALKAAMRADPDAILVGEIRDSTTARLGKSAVETGHKVFSTLHADGAFGAVERLVELGVERSTFGRRDFLNVIAYQHLVATLCPHCQTGIEGFERHADEDRAGIAADVMRDVLRLHGSVVGNLRFRGGGCEHCRGMGVSGRTVVAELMIPDRTMQRHILENRSYLAEAYWRGGLWQGCPSDGIWTLRQHALAKMHAGLVSPEDVYRTLGDLEPERVEEERDFYRDSMTKGGV